MHLMIFWSAADRTRHAIRPRQTAVFAVGSELNEKQWRAAIRQMVAMGRLAPDTEAFGALKLTESARGVLKGDTEVMLREDCRARVRAIQI